MLEQYDLLKWIEYEAKKNSVEEIVLYGSSMGSAAVGYASDKITEPKVKVLVIDCAFVSPDRQLRCDGRTRKLPTFLLLPVMRVIAWFDMHEDIYRPVGKSLQNTHIPVLFIHGEADRTVPIEQGMENYKACGSEKEFISVAGADHILAYVTGGKEVQRKTEEFINKHLKGSTA